MYKFSKISRFLFLFLFALMSCNKETKTTPSSNPPNIEVDTKLYEVTKIEVKDIANTANGSDVAIRFFTSSKRSTISEYQIFLTKTSSTFDFKNAASLNSNQVVTVITTKTNKAIRLSPDFKDTDGSNISTDVQYHVGIISIFNIENEDYRSFHSSEPFSLTSSFPQEVFTIPAIFKEKDGLDGMTIDNNGNVYVSNFGVFENGAGSGTQVYKITPSGELTVHASGLTVPGGILADKAGNVFVSNGNNITKITQDGKKSVYATYTEGFAGLVMDEEGNIFSGGFAHSKLLKISPGGKVDIILDDPMLLGTVGIAYHQNTSTIYTGNFNNGNILAISKSGDVKKLATLSGIGYITEMNDLLYATLIGSNQIAQVSLSGNVTIITGSSATQKDGSLEDAGFNQPNGIIGDATNNVLYVSDWGSPRITKIQLR